MKFDIEIKTPQESNFEEIVHFTIEAEKHLSPQMRCRKDRQEVEKHIKETYACGPFHYIFVKQNDRILGLAGCFGFTESMMYFEYWHPLVLQGEHHDDIFQILVKESIKHTKSQGRNCLEVFLMNITDENRVVYSVHRLMNLQSSISLGRKYKDLIDSEKLELLSMTPNCEVILDRVL